MKKEDVIKQLVPGVIVGIILGSVIGYLVGVDTVDVMKNHIGGLMACLIPCLLNCVIVVKGTAKVLKQKLTVPRAFVVALPEIILGSVIGIVFHIVILTMMFRLNTCEFTRIQMTLVNMVLGVVVSTLMGYMALKSYENKVKATKVVNKPTNKNTKKKK